MEQRQTPWWLSTVLLVFMVGTFAWLIMYVGQERNNDPMPSATMPAGNIAPRLSDLNDGQGGWVRTDYVHVDDERRVYIYSGAAVRPLCPEKHEWVRVEKQAKGIVIFAKRTDSWSPTKVIYRYNTPVLKVEVENE